MTEQELEKIVEVLREGLPDDTCRTQLGLLIYHFMKERNDELRKLVTTLSAVVDVNQLDDVTKIIVLAHRS